MRKSYYYILGKPTEFIILDIVLNHPCCHGNDRNLTFNIINVMSYKHTIARKGFIARTTYFYVGFKNYCQSLRKGQIMNTQVALFFAVLLLQFIGLC